MEFWWGMTVCNSAPHRLHQASQPKTSMLSGDVSHQSIACCHSFFFFGPSFLPLHLYTSKQNGTQWTHNIRHFPFILLMGPTFWVVFAVLITSQLFSISLFYGLFPSLLFMSFTYPFPSFCHHPLLLNPFNPKKRETNNPSLKHWMLKTEINKNIWSCYLYFFLSVTVLFLFKLRNMNML